MTIGINNNAPLLATLLEQGRQADAGKSADGIPGVFSQKLQQALGGTATTATPAGAAILAEALKLQMAQTTLSLSGDRIDGTPSDALRNRPFSINQLVAAYTSQEHPPSPSASSSLPQSTQLQELAGVPTAAPVQPQSQSSSWLDPIIEKASRRYGVETGLIKAVIKAESNFNPQAVSHAGARGLMQLMPDTARSLGVSDSFDPEQNVMAGTKFLRDLLKKYNGDLDSALAAYNWGPGNVDKRPDRLPRETREYQSRVKQFYSTFTA